MDYGHWQYSKEFNSDDWFGFVYRIVDLSNNMEYIGKKQFIKTRRKVVKNRKNRKVIKSDSDWRSYTGSSVVLNEQIQLKGKEKFSFHIMSLHKTKASLSYGEVEAQIHADVLRAKLPDGNKKYYNKMVYINLKNGLADLTQEETNSIESATSELISEGRKRYWRLFFEGLSPAELEIWKDHFCRGDNNPTKRNKTTDEYEAWKSEKICGDKNPMFGRTGNLSPRFGKSPHEKWNDEKLDQFRKKMSELTTGERNPRYGRSPFENFTPERLEQHKKMLSEKMSGDKNPMYGKSSTYKMTDEEIAQWKENISRSTRGKQKSDATKDKMRKPKGPQPIVVCPHCNKSGGISNMKKYHFDNCKYKVTGNVR